MAKLKKVFEVVYDTGTDGRMGDGIEIYRTLKRPEADSFAYGRTCYGQPATVDLVEVPAHIAARWGF